jgi:glycosyltransferase involved in cell wall biosynthesis
MKILQIITSLHIGGAEKLMVDLLPRFKQDGFEVDLLLFDGSDTPFKQRLQESGIRIFELKHGGSVYNPLHIFRLIPYFKKYDIIHTHNTAPQFFCAIAGVLYPVVLVTTEHSTFNRRRRRSWKWYRLIDQWMYNRYRKVICISDKTEKNLRSHLGNSFVDISTIYNGIDTVSFANTFPDEQFSKNYAAYCKLIMVAGFRYQKDQKTVIRAVALLPEEYHIFFVGDGPEKVKCEALANELAIADRVHFLGIRTNIPQLLQAADIVIMSSHWEGFGLAAVEGMAAHKPVLATDIDGIREVVQGAGLLFEHENERQLATEIKTLMLDSRLYQKIADRCFACAREYDISKMAEQYEKTYSDIYHS